MPEPTKLNASNNHDHPIGLELASLRAAVAQFQDESHVSSVKLQRHSLDTSNANERAHRLERENAMLRSELAVLRANPLPKESPESLQDKKTLTMALRRLSEELNLAEATILERNNELASARNAAARAKYVSDNAYELAARIRGREEEGKQREFELERRVRAAEEEARMSDLVVKEYASLVRSLNRKNESRPMDTNTSLHNNAVTLTNSLSEGKIGLQKLLAEFNAETERLNAEVLRLQGELAELGAQLDAEKKGAHDGRLELSRVQLELQRLQRDDNAAAKMVSRYMKFSQHATDVLQTAMDSLKTRHAATVDTLSSQISTLTSEIEPLHSTIERLRQALDELTGNILRETYGRRREVALRIRLVGREERTRESLQRFIHRYHDAIRRDELPDSPDGHIKIIQDAEQILSSLDTAPPIASPPPPDDSVSSGSVARIAAVECGLAALLEELDTETARRLDLERLIARGEDADALMDAGSGEISQEISTDEQEVQTDQDLNHEQSILVARGEGTDVPVNAGNGEIPRKSSTGEQGIQTDRDLNHEQLLDSRQMSSKLVQVVPESPVVPTAPPLSEATAPPAGPHAPEHDVSSPRPQPAQIEENQTTPCLEDPPITLHEDIHSPAPIAPHLPPDEQTTDSIVASTSAEIITLSHTGSPVIEHGVPSPTQTGGGRAALRLEDPPVDIHEDIRSPTPDITPSPLNEQPANPLPLPSSDEHPDMTVERLPQNNPTPTTTPSPSNEQQTDPLPLSAGDEHPDTTVESFSQDNRRSPTPDVIPLLNEQQTDPPSLSTGDGQPDTIVESLPQDNRNDGPPCGAEPKSHESVPPPSIFVEPEQSGPERSYRDVDSSLDGATDSPPIPKNAHDTDDTDIEPSLTPLSAEAPTPHEPPVLPSSPALNETFPIILPTHSEAVEVPAPHPLIAQLAETRHRYDDLKHNFRDCNLALQALKDDITTSTPNLRVIQTALERLSDYTEDARVELEIRIADEELLARGFETILSIPGALSHSSTSTGAGDDSPPSQTEVEAQIEAFVSGAEPSIQRSLQTFTRKLTDVQHDIAALKRTIHDPDLSTSPPAAPESETRNWRSWIEKSPSPSPTPTFGNIMTAPRLKHSTSLYGHLKRGPTPNENQDPFANLGLRVSMPSYLISPQPSTASKPRTRTISNMYTLGLGPGRSASTPFSSPQRKIAGAGMGRSVTHEDDIE